MGNQPAEKYEVTRKVQEKHGGREMTRLPAQQYHQEKQAVSTRAGGDGRLAPWPKFLNCGDEAVVLFYYYYCVPSLAW
jgi:hypothetical protein